MKKLFTFIVGAAVSLGAYAQDFDSGDLKYSVLSPDDKTCAVTGYSEIGSVLEIPEKVSFEEEEYTVTKIGDSAFRYIGANSIIFPSTLEIIGDNAFFNCNGLSEVVIPNSVKEIGMWSFYACYGLTKLELGTSIENIGAGAFTDCPLDVVVVLGEKPAQFYDGYANSFNSNPLVAVEEGVVDEYKAAWEGANIVANIPAESVSFDPDNYSVIPGNSVQLNCIVYPENAPVVFSTWNTDIISVDENGLVNAVPLKGGYTGYVTATTLNGMTATCSIHTEYLEEFELNGLRFTIIPETENEVALMGYDYNITNPIIPESIEYNGNVYSVTTIGPSVFNWRDIEEIVIPASIKMIREYNFSYCSSLKKVTIADSAMPLELSTNNFTDCNSFTDIYIGRNLTYSNDCTCFQWIYNLEHIVLGQDITSLPSYIFRFCNNLRLVECLSPEPPVIGESVFGYTNPTIVVPTESIEAYQNAWEQYAQYIIVAVDAENISFETEEVTIYNGQSLTLPVTVEPEGATVIWSSSDPYLVGVDKYGNIWYDWGASEVGEAIITASSLNGISAECKVTAKHWLTFTEDKISMTPGSTYQVEVTKPEELAESPITWISTDNEIVVVDENGEITAVACGNAEVIASVNIPGWEEAMQYYIQIEVLNEPTAVTAEESEIYVWAQESTSINLNFEPSDDEYLNREITWTVADPEIAEVITYYGTNYGVRGLKGGSTTITGETVNGLRVEIEVKVKSLVDEIIFPSERIYMTPGQSRTLEFTTVPEESNQIFRYTSSNEDIVTVDENGIITAHNVGNAEIGVWTETPWGDSYVWWQPIEVCIFPESVKFAGSSDYVGTLTNWTWFQLEFTPDNEDVCKRIEWTAEDPSIVFIDTDNSFIGRDFGTTSFKGVAINGDVLEGTITIKGIKILVDDQPASSTEMNLGNDLKLGIEASSEELLENISYTSDNSEIVTVNEDGVVTAVGCGSTTVTAMAAVQINENEWYSYSSRIEITVRPNEGIIFNTNEIVLNNGNSSWISILRPENEEAGIVTWESSDENVVSINYSDSNEALLLYEGPGRATITATDENGYVATCEVYCLGFTINPSEVNMFTNSTFQLEAIALPEDVYVEPINWISNDPEFVSVDENGLLTTNDVIGLTRIYAYTWINGYYVESSCEVRVSEYVPVTEITLNETSISAEEGAQIQLIATINPEDASIKELRWESSNEEVATVDENGLVTILAVGDAVITVYATDESGVSASCAIFGTSGINALLTDGSSFDIYDMNGIVVKKDATAEDYKQLDRGIYLIRKGNSVIKIKR